MIRILESTPKPPKIPVVMKMSDEAFFKTSSNLENLLIDNQNELVKLTSKAAI